MELEFKKNVFNCLRECVHEVQNGEETLEIRLPDGSADIGRVLAAWGQPVLRSKEWRDRQITISCGMMVWVLYCPEDETQVQCLEGWIPYQFRWDLPQNTREGVARVDMAVRFVDARSVSPRKIMVRAGLGVLLQALVPHQSEIPMPEAPGEELQLLKRTYPIRYMKDSGEKSFQISEQLTLPQSVPQVEKICYYSLKPEITEQKSVGSRAVFKGNADLHLLYLSETGQLHTWDFSLPFSQYAQLEEAPSGENWVDVWVCPVNLELDLAEGEGLQLKASFTAQYLAEETVLQEVVADAYCPGRPSEARQETLDIPVVMDTRWERLSGEQTVPGDANIPVDVVLLTDYPAKQTVDGQVRLEIPHSLQVLYYGENSVPKAAVARWETVLEQKTGPGCTVMALPGVGTEPHVLPSGDSMSVQWEVPMRLRCTGESGIPVVTAMELGERSLPDENGPSLLLKRVGETGLWELAKQTGSTPESIRKANGLEGEPSPGQFLLIPLPS